MTCDKSIAQCFPSTNRATRGQGADIAPKKDTRKGVLFLYPFMRGCDLTKRTIIIFSFLFLAVLGITTATNHYFIHPPDTYLGNSTSHIFHTTGCSSGKQIKLDNRVYFESLAEALDQNYRPCKVCNPK